MDWDSSWNWVYFSNSREERSTFFYAYFSRSGEVVTHKFDNAGHRFPPAALHLLLGSAGPYFGMNGHYFNL
jgi:hypothetical protein